jgi:assimilatory nitrate reductase catalytic subunit
MPADVGLKRRAELLAACSELDFAVCMPFGREPGATGVWLRAAAPAAPSAEWLSRIEALLGLDHAEVLRYADPQRGQRRSMRLMHRAVAGGADAAVPNGTPTDALLKSFMLAGDTLAGGWVSDLLLDELPAQRFGRALLAGTAKPPVALPSRGTQVCNCFDVCEPDITAVLERCSGSAESRLAQLQGALQCGTNCGSCLPALRQQVQRVQPTAQTV